ncbi:hypothetical protein VP01_453g13 [Puccinia sorghi]|uniref:Uncharacterized protein n=1 Tax=Puccinia sorghi TaxID=27349 RepID=A0A0L6UNW4_9BASI|nr:hypothetical protein VP01_453g13 [Puccinia sorghi]
MLLDSTSWYTLNLHLLNYKSSQIMQTVGNYPKLPLCQEQLANPPWLESCSFQHQPIRTPHLTHYYLTHIHSQQPNTPTFYPIKKIHINISLDNLLMNTSSEKTAPSSNPTSNQAPTFTPQQTIQHKLRSLRVQNRPKILSNQSSQKPITSQPSLSAAQLKPSPLPPATVSKSPVKTPAKKKANPCSSVVKIPSLDQKKHPNQMVTKDFPKDLKSVPPQADPEHIRIFSAYFQNINQFEKYITDSNSAALISQKDILTVKDASCQIWGPNLDKGPEILFNSECQISALISFEQIDIAGGYNFLNFNPKYKDDMLLFICANNHYVHHVLSQKYQTECNMAGKNKQSIETHNATRNHAWLQDAPVKFAVMNELPERDDELDGKMGCFSIKTLKFQSNCAIVFFFFCRGEMQFTHTVAGSVGLSHTNLRPWHNKFFRRLDLAMKSALMTSCMLVRRLPIPKFVSTFTKPPIFLPLDFYHCKWLMELPTGRQRTIPDVVFLSDPEKSLFAKNHSSHDVDERLSDCVFNKKYLDNPLDIYNIKEIVEETESDENKEDEEIEDDDEEVESEVKNLQNNKLGCH